MIHYHVHLNPYVSSLTKIHTKLVVIAAALWIVVADSEPANVDFTRMHYIVAVWDFIPVARVTSYVIGEIQSRNHQQNSEIS